VTPNLDGGSVTIGFGGGFQYGPGGANAQTSIGMDTNGRVCMQYTKCGQVGFGLFGGLGVTGNISEGTFCEGTTESEGPFYEGGSLIVGGGSVTEDSSGNSNAASGLYGIGMGAAGGYQWCSTTTTCFN